jgi:hypothetical protein
MSLGPGAYNMMSEFEKTRYSKELDDNNTYLTNDNGHLNRKTQIYANQSLKE